MLQPKKTKFRKQQKGRVRGYAMRGCNLAYGNFGLQSLDHGWVNAKEIEAARMAVSRHVKRGGKLFCRIFPDKPITKKPAETRMGKGKGAPDHWVSVVKKGKVLFEMDGVPLELARECMRVAAHKIPFRTRFITRA